MLQKTISIRTVCKRNVKNLSVFHCLLHTSSKRLVIVFRFDNSNGFVGGMKQEIISLLYGRHEVLGGPAPYDG